VALWIVVAAPTMTLLAFGIGAPELSPMLLVVAVTLGVLSAFNGPTAINRAAMCLAIIAGALCAIPLARLPGAVRHFDEAFRRAGIELRMARDDVRPRPVVARDLLLGVRAGEPRIVRGVAWAVRGGVTLTVDIYRPQASGQFPIVVQIYGGAWQRGAPADDDTFARYVSSRGYVVFAIDYRHAPQWQWPAQIDDVDDAIAWIRAHASEHGGDVTRMALVGRSAGAQLALVAAYRGGRPAVSAVVSYYGPTNLSEGWRVPPRPDPLPVRPVLEAYLGGTPQQVAERYRQASPVTYVSAKVPPTLLIYGTRDHIVDARFGRELDERLRSAGATSVLLEIPWAEHAFDRLQSGVSGQVSLYYTERFLASTLK
jgi:acetyl esterase/lipase